MTGELLGERGQKSGEHWGVVARGDALGGGVAG